MCLAHFSATTALTQLQVSSSDRSSCLGSFLIVSVVALIPLAASKAAYNKRTQPEGGLSVRWRINLQSLTFFIHTLCTVTSRVTDRSPQGGDGDTTIQQQQHFPSSIPISISTPVQQATDQFNIQTRPVSVASNLCSNSSRPCDSNLSNLFVGVQCLRT